MLRLNKFPWCAIVTMTAAVLGAASITFAENFTYVGGVGLQNWEVDGNWNGDALELIDKYPGQTQLADTALMNVPLAGNLTVDISGAANIQVSALSMGDTDATPNTSTITGTGGGSLIATTINSLGTTGAVNNINANLRLPTTGTTTIGSGSTNPLTINGMITVTNGGAKTLSNASAQSLTVNNISLSSGVAAGVLTITQGGTGTVMNLNGVISDGAVAPASPSTSQVIYARGIFHNRVSNTYTGATTLGANSPNATSTNIMYTDGVFSTGRLIFGGNTAIKTVEGAAGFGTRTLSNEVQISRDARFAGSESISLTGTVFQSSTRSIINDITGSGKILSLNGPIFTDSGTNAADLGRILTFTGSGRTEVSGTIDDKLGNAAANLGRVRQSGTGRTVFMNNSVVAYGSATEVTGGTLQLGTGGVPVNVNSHSVQGTTVGGGTLEINHSGSLSFDASLGYNLAVTHVGTGTTTMTDHSYGTGTINVSGGKLLVNGGTLAGSAMVGARSTPVDTMTVSSTAGLRVGQPISGTPVTGTGTFVVDAYVAEIINATTIRISGNVNNISDGSVNWNLSFGAGTGTGTANVIVGAAGTVGGTGVIGGLLGAAGTVAPGASAGTLTVNGAVILNPASTLAMELTGNDQTVGGGINDLLVSGSNLTLDGTLNVTETAAGSFLSASAGDSWRLINYAGTLTDNTLALGSLPALSSGLFFQIQTSILGQVNLRVAAVPEASAFIAVGLVALGSGVATYLRRRQTRAATK